MAGSPADTPGDLRAPHHRVVVSRPPPARYVGVWNEHAAAADVHIDPSPPGGAAYGAVSAAVVRFFPSSPAELVAQNQLSRSVD